MKELDILKQRCEQSMIDIDNYVDNHRKELIDSLCSEHNIPKDWQIKIVSNCGTVSGCCREKDDDEWNLFIYHLGKWNKLELNF
jgi:hypothetical protein